MASLAGLIVLIAVLAPIGELVGTIYKVGWHFEIIRYVMSEQINQLDIIVAPIPHDCEFMIAPIGNKNCKYTASWYPVGSKLYVTWYKEFD
jgi:hypothetical protein